MTFWGRVSLNPLLEKNEDQAILEFIEKIEKNSNQRLILTTREYILRDAAIRYERISHSDITKHKYILKLGKYSTVDRANILFNHLYFSELPQGFVEALVKSSHLVSIVRHKHYNPRIVEAMTMGGMIDGTASSDYAESFLNNLNDPKLLYQHIFDNQLSDSERSLLYVMYSLAPECELDVLEGAFTRFVKDSDTANVDLSIRRTFEQALKRLDDTLTSMRRLGDVEYISFHNPSVEEFVGKRIQGNLLVASALCKTASFSNQCWTVLQCVGASSIGKASEEFRKNLFQNVEKRIGTELGSLYAVTNPFGQTSKMIRLTVSRPRQMMKATEVLSNFADEKAKAILQGTVEELLNLIENNKCTCADAVNACRRLNAGRMLTSPEYNRLEEGTAKLLVSRAADREDWDALKVFLGLMHREFGSGELLELEVSFESYCSHISGSDMDDADNWEEEAQLIGWFSENLQWEFDEYAELCVAKAEEIRSNEAPDFDDEERRSSGAAGVSSYVSDAEVVSMFSPLLEGFRGEY